MMAPPAQSAPPPPPPPPPSASNNPYSDAVPPPSQREPPPDDYYTPSSQYGYNNRRVLMFDNMSPYWFGVLAISGVIAVHILLGLASYKSSPTFGLVMSLLVFIIAVPIVFAGLFFVLIHATYTEADEAYLLVFSAMTVILVFVIPAAAVSCTFAPMLRTILVPEYTGVLPNTYSPKIEGLTNTYDFQGISVQYQLVGSSQRKYRTKNGYVIENYYAAPMLSASPSVVGNVSQNVYLWACGCARANGCRNFPAIDVSFANAAFKKVNPVESYHESVRVRSKRLRQFCIKAALNSLPLMATSGVNFGYEAPLNGGAIFVEMTDFDKLGLKLKLIIFVTGVVLDASGFFSAILWMWINDD
eukprot:c40328_g1_i1.p1 GENE.c40328_g1_i1~~c40328_g1_i1.p1  ORF type:complete len:380 (+),score=79.28 c40328_g1_i1:69-1142(+)